MESDRKNTSKAKVLFVVLVSFFTGVYSSVLVKIAYDAGFQKPFAFTVFMFWGELLCLVVYYFKTKAAERAGEMSPLLNDEPENRPKPPKYYYAILSLFDCTATLLTMVGQVYITVSLAQMLRGSMIVFTAIFTFLFLKRKQTRLQIIALGIVVLALFLVGLSGIIFPSGSDSATISATDVFLGICLVLLGSAFNAIQGVVEEKLLKAVAYSEVDSSEVVGWEGLFGTIVSMFVILPICEHLPSSSVFYENTWTTTYKDDVQTLSCSNTSLSISSWISTSNPIPFLCNCSEVNAIPIMSNCTSIVSIVDSKSTIDLLKDNWYAPVFFAVGFAVFLCAFNYFSQEVTKHLSAVVRQLVNTAKVVLVWIISLVIFYGINEAYGENWDNGSYIQLTGFAVLVFGTGMYIRAPKDVAPPKAINA